VGLTKSAIVRRGAELGVDFGRTWSCYKGGEVHCGTCGTCVERREAFHLAGVPDPTAYAG
jgi:7-cyano-7-deazaguanine synthase